MARLERGARDARGGARGGERYEGVTADVAAALLVVDLGDEFDHEGAETVEGAGRHAGVPPRRAIWARVRARRSRISAPGTGRTTE
jgi:hypothetical protein